MVLSSSGSSFRVRRAKATYGRAHRGSTGMTSSSLTSLPHSDDDSAGVSDEEFDSSSEDESSRAPKAKAGEAASASTKSASTSLPPWKLAKAVRRPLGQQPASVANIPPKSKRQSPQKVTSRKPSAPPTKDVCVMIPQQRHSVLSSPLSSPPLLPRASSGNSRRSAVIANRRVKAICYSDEEEENWLSEKGRDSTLSQSWATSAELSSSSDAEDAQSVERSLAHLTFKEVESDDDEDADDTPVLEEEGCLGLLSLCGQARPYDFGLPLSRLIEVGTPDDLVVVPAGEASYSFVFRLKELNSQRSSVLKIIPLLSARDPIGRESNEVPRSQVGRSSCSEVAREVLITQTLQKSNRDGAAFVELVSSAVVKGTLPSLFAKQIVASGSSPTSHRKRRSEEHSDQGLYALLQLGDSGIDLENYPLRTWTSAAAVLAQVVHVLAAAEETHNFEHRDLHWGNVLVQPQGRSRDAGSKMDETGAMNSQKCSTWSSLLLPSCTGLKVTIIDFTLSRIGTESEVECFDLSTEPELFTGDAEVDEQFEVYRSMRTLLLQRHEDLERDSKPNSEWSAQFDPRTNILWIHYLVRKLIYEKGLGELEDAHDPSHSAEANRSLANSLHRRRLLRLENVLEARVKSFLGQAAQDTQRTGNGSLRRRRTHTRTNSRASATLGSIEVSSLVQLRDWLAKEWS
ncbi:unnamed protein product [Parajaminaea phylloscopi]